MWQKISEDRQNKALDKLREFRDDNGYDPTNAELGELLGVSHEAARQYLLALERAGRIHIHRRPSGHRISIAIM